MEDTKRSPFAQALYDLMIEPGINTMEEWCFIIDPWVMYEGKDGSTITTWGPEAHGAPHTMARIQRWFDDEEMPTPEDLQIIRIACEDGKAALFLSAVPVILEGSEEQKKEVDADIKKYADGMEKQEQALAAFDAILNGFWRDASPLRAEPIEVFPPRISGLLIESHLSGFFAHLLSEVPLAYHLDVIRKITTVIDEAKEKNWYRLEEKSPPPPHAE